MKTFRESSELRREIKAISLITLAIFILATTPLALIFFYLIFKLPTL